MIVVYIVKVAVSWYYKGNITVREAEHTHEEKSADNVQQSAVHAVTGF